MCGIAGIMMANGAPPDAAMLERMADALGHRGPDGRGHYRNANVAMVQNRLAIIDLETGDQPLYEPGGAALICNGEIYNYIELRQDPALAGINFATASDCEPPLHLYRRLGAAFVERLRGMYALALHDAPAGRLLLARDPFGIKPLYYVEQPQLFAFASEPRALLAAGLVQPLLEPTRLAELLELQFTTGRDTPFQGIRRLLPGETLILAEGRIVERSRREALPAGGPEHCDDIEALARLESALVDSVSVHQRSDVPYGMFLSGGVDSSVLLALMARLNDRPVKAFTVGFEGKLPDERLLARKLAARVGAEHVEIEFGERDFWALLPPVAEALDDPVADYAALPTYRLAREAGSSLKVILTGEGGDELFAGYGRYRSAVRPWWIGGRTMRARGILDSLDLLRSGLTGWRDGIAASEHAAAAMAERSRLQLAQAVDMTDWLPNDLLNKVDRCLMAHSVEGRVPFLDPVVAQLAFRLPDRLKVQQGRGKWLLRQWLARALPEAEPFSRKRGFTVPVGRWIRRAAERIGPLVARQAGVRELCGPGKVERLYERRGKHAQFAEWTLLFFACWHQRHVMNIAGARDAFELLDAA